MVMLRNTPLFQEAGLPAASGGAPAAEPPTQLPAAGAPPPSDDPVQEPAAPAEDPMARKLLRVQEQLKRQERELRKRDARLAEMEDDVKLARRLREDPLDALKGAGHSYDDLTRRVLEETTITPEQAELMSYKQKVDALEKERAEEKQTLAQRQAEQARQANLDRVSKYLEETEELAYSGALGLSGELLARIEAHVSENGAEPTPEEQAEVNAQIAAKLEEEARSHAASVFSGLLKRSPEFREAMRKQLEELAQVETPTPSQPETKATPRTRTSAPRTVTREQLSAVESRKDQTALTLEERKQRGREKALARINQSV